jgi:hypothetical protein
MLQVKELAVIAAESTVIERNGNKRRTIDATKKTLGC